MKLLMVTPYLPYPPASGGQIRTLNLLKYLSRGNEIVLVALYKKESDKKYLSYLEPYCKEIHLCKRPENPWQIKNILQSMFSLKPFLIVRNFSPDAKRKIEQLLRTENFDVIHCETFYVMPHLPKTKVPILLVEQTIEYEVYQHFVDELPIIFRLFFYFDIVKLKYWERYYWKKATTVATVSFDDEKIIKRLESHIYPVIIPNGAGDEMFVSRFPQKTFKNPTLLFIGNFFWLQNKEAAEYLVEKIAPHLAKKFPRCRVVLAGQEAQRLQKSELKNVTIVDIRPEDSKKVKSLYQNATLFIAPIHGPGGTRLKILAAMAAGLPVVGTKTGFEGLNVEDMEDVLVANTKEEFVKKIKLVLSNRALYRKLQKNAFIKAKEKYSWNSISKRLEIVYKLIQKEHENRN